MMRMRSSSGIISWVLFGAIAGLVAGGAFILFEMVSAKYAGRPAAAPLRLIATITRTVQLKELPDSTAQDRRD